METRFGEVTVTHSSRGVPTYRVELFHDGLHKYTVIRAGDDSTFRNKCLAQAQQWNSAWKTLSAWEQHNRLIESRKEAALERTTEAEHVLDTLRNILVTGIGRDPTLDWDQLRLRTPFQPSAPTKPVFEPEPSPMVLPTAPDSSNREYRPKFSLLDHLIASRKEIRISGTRNRYELDMKLWRDDCARLSNEGHSQLAATRAKNARLQEEYVQAVHKWEQEKLSYYEEQKRQHAAIDGMHGRYDSKVPDAVIEYCERVLSNSDYPDCIPREFDFELNQVTGVH
jgi:restriction system protein